MTERYSYFAWFPYISLRNCPFGTHPIFINMDLYDRVQAIVRGHNKPKYRKQDFAFRGLLRCAQDECAITAERKKGKYVYYRCTGYRGKCATPRFAEQEMAEKLAVILKGIQIPDHVLANLQKSLAQDQEKAPKRYHRTRQYAAGTALRCAPAHGPRLSGQAGR